MHPAATQPQPQDLAAQLAPMMAELTESIRLAASIPADRRLVSKTWLMAYFDIRATALERLIAQPGFPAPIKIPSGPLRWKAVEVMDWAEAQSGQRTKRAKSNKEAA
jgi:predicted DNA-binding transcriptional regulator AlpA